VLDRRQDAAQPFGQVLAQHRGIRLWPPASSAFGAGVCSSNGGGAKPQATRIARVPG
jgi:hypothetical protein